jgi:hypothetical protein
MNKDNTLVQRYGPSWSGQLGENKDGSYVLYSDYAKLEAKVKELEQWKSEQLQVEEVWDVQAVARELNIKLGAKIRSNILPGIIKLKQRISELEAEAHPEEDDLWSTVYGPRPVTGKQIRDAMARQLTPEATAPPTLRERAEAMLKSVPVMYAEEDNDWEYPHYAEEETINAMLQFASEVGEERAKHWHDRYWELSRDYEKLSSSYRDELDMKDKDARISELEAEVKRLKNRVNSMIDYYDDENR